MLLIAVVKIEKPFLSNIFGDAVSQYLYLHQWFLKSSSSQCKETCTVFKDVINKDMIQLFHSGNRIQETTSFRGKDSPAQSLAI